MVHVTSAEIPLTVRPKPDTWPASAPWLPARSLSMSETWNPEPDHTLVGDSLTRTLTLKAEQDLLASVCAGDVAILRNGLEE